MPCYIIIFSDSVLITKTKIIIMKEIEYFTYQDLSFLSSQFSFEG